MSVRNLPVLMHKQHVLRFGIFLVHVVGVARGDQRQTHPLGHFDCRLLRLALDVQAVVLDLDEVAVPKT